MKTDKADGSTFEIDKDAIYLDFELEDGNKIESLSYISLRSKTFEFSGNNREKITLNFDSRIIEILGSDIKPLFDSIGKHVVSLIRKGKGKDKSEPSVREINVINPHSFIAPKE